MIRRLAVLAVVTLLLIGLLTFLVPGRLPLSCRRPPAQEPLVVPFPQPPVPRDPATVSSELLPDPAEQAFVPPPPPAPRWAGLGYINDVGSAASGLRRQVVQLKGDANTNLRGERRRELSRKADDVLDALDALEDRLVVGRPRAAVAEEYVAVEARVHAHASGDAPGRARPRRLGRAGGRAVGGGRGRGRRPGDVGPGAGRAEADNLVFVARDLERQGEYALSAGPGRRSLQTDLHSLSDAAEFFRAGVATGSPRAAGAGLRQRGRGVGTGGPGGDRADAGRATAPGPAGQARGG